MKRSNQALHGGQATIKVCLGEKCCQKGAQEIFTNLKEGFKPDEAVILAGKECFGYCAEGPCIAINDNIVKLQFGGSTDGEVMMACVVITNTWNGMLYIADAKISANADVPTTVYQKVCANVIPGGALQLRVEALTVTRDVSFFRIGAEYQIHVPFPSGSSGNSHLYAAPFYDPIRGAFGAQIGARFIP